MRKRGDSDLKLSEPPGALVLIAPRRWFCDIPVLIVRDLDVAKPAAILWKSSWRHETASWKRFVRARGLSLGKARLRFGQRLAEFASKGVILVTEGALRSSKYTASGLSRKALVS